MDYLLLGLVSILSFLIGFFICQKRLKQNNTEKFSPLNVNKQLKNNFIQYGEINKQLMNDNINTIESMDNRHNLMPNIPQEQNEKQRLHKIMSLNGEEEINNIQTFMESNQEDDVLESFDNYSKCNF